jgi:Ni,Fe-hydrogenase III large subunit/Ni,Fe-hydrogenase III component G
MDARARLNQLKEKFGSQILRADFPNDRRLYVYVDPAALKAVCRYVFRDLDARYVISVGADDRPYSGNFMVYHDFAFDKDKILSSIIVQLPADNPKVDSISDIVPGANWAEREIRDMFGIEPVGHPYPKRLILPDGWPDGLHPLRKDMDWNHVPKEYDEDREFSFSETPPGCTVVPFGPFHPTLDEPAHFRLYVEGEMVRGCEYRGFMVHRGIEKLSETVLSYNDVPMMAERICGICGCVHSVAYVQAVENAAAIKAPPRAEYIRSIMLEIERLHSHLLWVGLACHLVGFDTLFMQSWRIREPIMWMAEKITGNRKTYGLCLVGGVRWDITLELRTELRLLLDKLESEWQPVVAAVVKDKNIQKRTSDVGVADKQYCKDMGLVGPVARAAGVDIDCRRDHPYAAYDRVEFDVITHDTSDVWGRVVVRAKEVFESIRIIRQCLDKMEPGPLMLDITEELPVGRLGLSSVEAPRGESHHFAITGENNKPRRWRVRAPTYQNLQGVPGMIKDQMIADMTISLGSIDPCFSCTDRMETIDLKSGVTKVWSQDELFRLVRERNQG